MTYLKALTIVLALLGIVACGAKDETSPLPHSPLTNLLAPTLAAAIVNADTAIQTALQKPDYSEATILTLEEIKGQLELLTLANEKVVERRANAKNAKQLVAAAEAIRASRALLEADIIALKDDNAAAAIRLGVVNELAEFCQLTADDIGRTLDPSPLQ